MGALSGPVAAAPVVFGIVDAMLPVQRLLESHDIRCYLDPKDINPPCCYLYPPAVAYRFGRGGFEATHTLLVTVGNVEREHSLQQLSDLLRRVQWVLADRAVTGRPAEVITADQSAALSAYELTWTDTLRGTTQ